MHGGHQIGKVEIGHSAGRKTEVGNQIQGIFDQGTLSTKEVERLRGRMIFFKILLEGLQTRQSGP